MPSRFAHRARPIRQYPADATSSRLLPPSPPTRGLGFLQLQPCCCDSKATGSFHPRPVKQRRVAPPHQLHRPARHRRQEHEDGPGQHRRPARRRPGTSARRHHQASGPLDRAAPAWPPLVGWDRGALPGLLPVGFPDPPSAPGVRLSPHRALHVPWPLDQPDGPADGSGQVDLYVFAEALSLTAWMAFLDGLVRTEFLPAQVTGPAGGIFSRPAVRLGRHLPYLALARLPHRRGVTLGAGIPRRVFGHYRSFIDWHTAALPHARGFPALGVLRRLRPARAFGWHRAYPPPPPWQGGTDGTATGSSHVHC